MLLLLLLLPQTTLSRTLTMTRQRCSIQRNQCEAPDRLTPPSPPLPLLPPLRQWLRTRSSLSPPQRLSMTHSERVA